MVSGERKERCLSAVHDWSVTVPLFENSPCAPPTSTHVSPASQPPSPAGQSTIQCSSALENSPCAPPIPMQVS